MKDSLVYRVSGDAQFNSAINAAKLTPPEGETIGEIGKTTPMCPNGSDPGHADFTPKRRRRRSKPAEDAGKEWSEKTPPDGS